MTVKALRKQLMAAIAMVVVSAVALSSSTYAWFASNNKVSATGMQVQAQAEGGILISNESKADWKTSVTASHADVASLFPTSTSNTTNWYHNVSDDANNAKAHQSSDTYSTLNISVDGNGLGVADSKAYYLLNKFYIKSSAEEVADGKIYIQKVTAEGVNDSGSKALDASLRVLISIGGSNYIYAPVTGATTGYYVAGASDMTSAIDSSAGDVNTQTSVSGIPANTTDTPLEASVYIYFEGEDEGCKSSNITATLDTLKLSIDFGTVATTAQASTYSRMATPVQTPETQTPETQTPETQTPETETQGNQTPETSV